MIARTTRDCNRNEGKRNDDHVTEGEGVDEAGGCADGDDEKDHLQEDDGQGKLGGMQARDMIAQPMAGNVGKYQNKIETICFFIQPCCAG